MIKCDEAKLQIEGYPTLVMSELTVIIRGVHECLVDCMGEENAKKAVAKCGRLAYMDTKPVEKYGNEIREALDSGDSERIEALRKKITEELGVDAYE